MLHLKLKVQLDIVTTRNREVLYEIGNIKSILLYWLSVRSCCQLYSIVLCSSMSCVLGVELVSLYSCWVRCSSRTYHLPTLIRRTSGAPLVDAYSCLGSYKPNPFITQTKLTKVDSLKRRDLTQLQSGKLVLAEGRDEPE